MREKEDPSPDDAPGVKGPIRAVVGLGASAGGLDALAGFFSQMPSDSGMAFIVVQHLDPHHPSMLSELLGRYTRMPVEQARNGSMPAPDHVYVIPPNAGLTLEKGHFQLAYFEAPGPHMVVDSLFRSLAEDRGERAVGIILSGTGSDGTSGLRSIREHEGLTLAQSPDHAKHDSMPRSAIAAGLVDHVLPVSQMPTQLLQYADQISGETKGPGLDAQLALDLTAICAILDSVTGQDFSRYKEATLIRRIRRRMHLRHAASPVDYRRLLETDPEEPQLLFKDLLIGVTQFFRDPEAFGVLGFEVLPRLVEAKPPDAPLRIWVPGCSSGEEAYSIAIVLRECLARTGSHRLVQLFATDIDSEMLAIARLGRYGPETANHMSRERLEKFFVPDEGGYQVAKELREMCIISAHNLTRDPPFSSLDLISCRNVLIYFDSELQKKLVPLFHYALRPGGFLFLGPSEGVATAPQLFDALDKRHRIFRRMETLTRPSVDFPAGRRRVVPPPPPPAEAQLPHTHQAVIRSFERLLVDEYAPCSAVVSTFGEIIVLGGRTAPYLQMPPGQLSNNLFDHLAGSLRLELRATLSLSAQTNRKISRAPVLVDIENSQHRVRLTVRPLPGEPRHFAVVIQPEIEFESVEREETPATSAPWPAIEQLESELKSTRADLKQAVEELESANEELKSSNEELISTNEELQSANEELQTSKEEMQSVNEELETVNAELQSKVQELGSTNSDLANLFASTEIATIFLDRELRVARFTPAATKVFSFIESDLGRPISDLAPRFEGHDLQKDVREVLATLTPVERHVAAKKGESWFVLRVFPYRTVENVFAGVVVTFVDVTQLKRAEEALRESEERFRLLVDGVRDYAIFMLTPDGRVATWNTGAERLKGYRADEILGQHSSRFYSEEDVRLGKPEEHLEKARTTGRFEEESWRIRKDGSRFRADVLIAALHDPSGSLRGYANVVRDVTLQRQAELERDRLAAQRQLALDSASLGWWHYDPVARWAAYDKRYTEIFGVSGHERANEEILTLLHPEDTPRVWKAVEAALDPKDPKPYSVEYRVNRPDGTMRWVEAHGLAVFEGEGAARYAKDFVGTVADITERKATEERLAYLATFPEENPNPIVEADAEGRVRYANASALRLFPDLPGKGPGHPWLRDWNNLVALVREGVAPNQRTVHAGGRIFAQEIYYVAKEAVIRTYGLDITERQRAEEALRRVTERERFLADVVENATTPFGVGSADGRLLLFNQAFADLTGYTRQELELRSLSWATDLTPPEWRETEGRILAQAVRDRTAVRYEKEYVRKDGSRVPIELFVQPVFHDDGTVLHYRSFLTDVTERKQREKEREQLLAELNATFGSMTDGLVVYRPDSSIAFMNPAGERIAGLPEKRWQTGTAEGAEALEMATEEGASLSPEATPAARALRGETVQGEILKLRRPDGTDRWVTTGAAPMVTGSGQQIGAVAVFCDITGRKNAEDGLFRSREGLSKLAEASLKVMASGDLSDVLQAISEAALSLTGARLATTGHGFVSGQLVVGGSARVAGMPSCPPGDMFNLEKGGVHTVLLEDRETVRLTDAEMRAHGRWWGLPAGHVPMRGLLGARMTTRSGAANGVILVTDKEGGEFSESDESLLKQLATVASLALQHIDARVALEDSDRRKGEFLGVLSHELRNPLAAIRNGLYLAGRAAPGGEQSTRALDIIDRQSQQLSRLTDDLLDLTRISRGKIRLQRETLVFNDLVRSTVEDYRQLFSNAAVELTVNTGEEPILVTVDGTRIRQVIGNVLSNAAKFTPRGGRTTVTLRAESPENTVLTIKDNGVGISADVLSRLFEPFVQSENTLDRSTGGLGLGLALVKGLVEQHGGQVAALSDGVGQGATFRVRLPIETKAAPGRAPVADPRERFARRVLVIEDNRDAAISMSEALELGDHEIEVAFSGPEGIEKARTFKPDLVLCDIGLPGMDGYQVARTLRADPVHKTLMIIALSGYAQPEDVERSREAGFDLHLAKPVDIEELERQIAECSWRTDPR